MPHYMKGVRAPAKVQIRVLCFGASITAGWSSNGAHYYPYSTRLSARLADELPTSHFSIDVDGGITIPTPVIPSHAGSDPWQVLREDSLPSVHVSRFLFGRVDTNVKYINSSRRHGLAWPVYETPGKSYG